MADAFEQTVPAAPIRSGSGGYGLAAVAAGGLTGWFNVNFILNHFYHYGPYLLDSGFLAALVYHTTPLLPIPPSLGGGSFLATHFTPILYLLSIPSNWVDWPMPAYYAITQGLIYGLVAFAGAWCARPLLQTWRGGPVLALLFGLGLGFAGITLAGVNYPHYEFMYGSWAILFLALLLQGKWRWAAGPFVLALLVREDCGLHLFGILLLLLGVAWMVPEWRPRRRALAGYMAAALGYSLLVIIGQRMYFPGDDALRRVYLGTPLFHHVTGELLRTRALYYLNHRKYLWIPHLLLLGAAVWRRSLVLLCGFLAVLPWMALNFLAVAPAAGELSLYYAFPLVVALIWPALTHAADPRRGPPAQAAIWQAVILGASLLIYRSEHGQEYDAMMKAGLHPEGFEAAAYRQGEAFVIALNRQPGRHVFDSAVAALFPNDITREERPEITAVAQPDTAVIYAGGPAAGQQLALVQSMGVSHHYALAGLPLYVMSKEPLPAALFPAAGVDYLGDGALPANFGLIVNAASQGRREADGSIRDEAVYARKQNVIYGPYAPLPPGHYTVTFELELSGGGAGDLVECDVATGLGNTVPAKAELTGAELAGSSGQAQEVSLTFEATDPAEQFEFRVQKRGAVRLRLKSYALVKAGAAPAVSGPAAVVKGAN